LKKTKEILNLLGNNYSDIEYYLVIIENIESNVQNNPDISIEACKSLIEGISKFILKILLGENYKSEQIDKSDFHSLVKYSLSKLSDHNEDIEQDFVNKVNKLVVSIGEIRNKRGDISHGKLSPKEYCSDCLFANLVMEVTDSLIHYILTCFSKIDLKSIIEYQDNPDFNEWLDDSYHFENLSYSKALFDQDFVAYEQELLSYNESIDNNLD